MASITVPRGSAFTIGALSKRTGVNIETIRFYERVGILPRPPRSAGGHRIYGQDQLMRLGFVRRSRELGFSLDDVRGLLRLVDGGRYTCAEVKAITLDHLANIHRKIADLRRLEETLA
jgi:MerR family mercuric resistance operon transcriptional regulator